MLIDANRQDQTVSRYATFDDLLGYCRLSANPVGRIVLHIFGAATPERTRLSDLVCTALQLAEHWQDVAEDFAMGRIYLPQEDMAAFGCTEDDLGPATREAATGPTTVSRRATPPRLRKLMRFETERAGRLLDEGAALTGTLRGWARLAVAGYVAGGRATLAALAAADSTRSPHSGRYGNPVSPGRPAARSDRCDRSDRSARSDSPAGAASSDSPAGFDVLAVAARPGRAKTAACLIHAYLTGR